jgi:hypothetical protein
MLTLEPYPGLTCTVSSLKRECAHLRVGAVHRWCMAVVSSCREVLG